MNEPTLEPEFKAFKDGVYDALMHGIHLAVYEDGTNFRHYYNRGYDFGMVIYSDKESEE